MQIGLPGEAICSREGQLCPARERANECAGRVMGNNTAPQREQRRARPAASNGAAREAAPCGQGHSQGCGQAVAAVQAPWASERKQGAASLEHSTGKKVAPAAGFVPWTLTGTRVLGGRGWVFGGAGGAKRGLEGTTAPPGPERPALPADAPGTYLTFLPSPLGSWPPGRRGDSRLEYLRFLGRPGPRRAGLRELSSLLEATGRAVRGWRPPDSPAGVAWCAGGTGLLEGYGGGAGPPREPGPHVQAGSSSFLPLRLEAAPDPSLQSRSAPTGAP